MVLEPASSGSSAGDSTSAAAPNATPKATKQFIDGSTLEITEPSVDVELSLPADEPLRFKISCYLSCASLSNDLNQQDIMNEIWFTIPRKIEFKSGSCTLSGSYRQSSYHQEFDFEGKAFVMNARQAKCRCSVVTEQPHVATTTRVGAPYRHRRTERYTVVRNRQAVRHATMCARLQVGTEQPKKRRSETDSGREILSHEVDL
ncbi:hypothetical protein AAVH_32703, partial [Aphelenchoides avenae]